MTTSNLSLNEVHDNTLPCLDFTRTHLVPVLLLIPPSTLAAITKAAAAEKTDVPDFLILSAYIRARDAGREARRC